MFSSSSSNHGNSQPSEIIIDSTDNIGSVSLSPITPNIANESESTISILPETTNESSDNTFIGRGGTVKRNEKASNEVWEYFRIYNEKHFRTHAFCVLCNKDVNYGKTHSTSSLDKHIFRHHKDEYKNIMTERAKKRICIESKRGTSTVTVQSKVTDYVDSNPEYQACLLKWLIATYQPLSTVEHETFRNMTSSLNRKVQVVGEGKIRRLLSTKYFETLHRISQILKGKDLALTTDAWTSVAKEVYVTCTLHFIERKTKDPASFCLGNFQERWGFNSNRCG
jgi:hypothetical protein